MPDILITAFSTTFFSMLKIFFVATIAGVLVRKGVLSRENIQGLAVVTVDVFLPCLSFSNILIQFQPGQFDIWWVLPLSAIAMTLAGMGVGALFFLRALPAKRNMIPLTGIQNGAYLVLPMGAVLFPDRFDLFSLYVFLYILGQNPVIWSIGKYMATAAPNTKLSIRGLVTPPLVATLGAILFVFTGFADTLFVPGDAQANGLLENMAQTFFGAVVLLGKATVPAATFILGGVLGSISFRLRPYLADTLRVVWVKLFMIPLLMLPILYWSGLQKTYPLLAIFFVIQAASAPAISTILQLKKYGGDEQKIGSVILVSYGACLVTLPLWVGIWRYIS